MIERPARLRYNSSSRSRTVPTVLFSRSTGGFRLNSDESIYPVARQRPSVWLRTRPSNKPGGDSSTINNAVGDCLH
jgi:hypothetical protein